MSGVPLAVESGVPLAVEAKENEPRTLVSRQGVSLGGTVVTMLILGQLSFLHSVFSL